MAPVLRMPSGCTCRGSIQSRLFCRSLSTRLFIPGTSAKWETCRRARITKSPGSMKGLCNIMPFCSFFGPGCCPWQHTLIASIAIFGITPASANPYIRGRVIALWLDGEIRKESDGKKSLDDVTFAMVHEADRPLTEARIIETIDRFLAADVRGSLEHLVSGGALPEFNTYPVGPCVTVSVDQVPTFDLGFDFEASKAAGKIVGVRDGGPAFQAGLRNGEQLLNKSVSHDQPDKLARFTVQTSAG